MATIDTERFRQALLEERERVVAAIEYLHEENPGSVQDETGDYTQLGPDDHLGDAATATLDRELDYTLEENSEHVLTAIDGALARIENGTFGTCGTCGQPIAVERLEAIPYATQCIDCKRRDERR